MRGRKYFSPDICESDELFVAVFKEFVIYFISRLVPRFESVLNIGPREILLAIW